MAVWRNLLLPLLAFVAVRIMTIMRRLTAGSPIARAARSNLAARRASIKATDGRGATQAIVAPAPMNS